MLKPSELLKNTLGLLNTPGTQGVVGFVNPHPSVEFAWGIGQVVNEGLVARPLRPYRMVIAAAPGYLQRHGTPRRARMASLRPASAVSASPRCRCRSSRCRWMSMLLGMFTTNRWFVRPFTGRTGR